MLRPAALLVIVLTAGLVSAFDLSQAQFQPEVAQRDQFGAGGFKFSFPQFAANNAAGTIRNMDLGSNPFLGTLPNGGLAINMDEFSPCTINVPHVHPRGSEAYLVLDGELEAGIQEEAGGQFNPISLSAGEVVIVPQGLLHYVRNPTCSNTSLLQIWNNADYGTVIAYANLVNNFPEDALEAFTNLDAGVISQLKAAVPSPTGPITQGQACLAQCGLASPSSTPSSSPAPGPPAPTTSAATSVSTAGRRLK